MTCRFIVVGRKNFNKLINQGCGTTTQPPSNPASDTIPFESHRSTSDDDSEENRGVRMGKSRNR